MEPLHFEAHGTFRVPPEALWPLVSDTARMNRAIGAPPVIHTVTPLDGGGSRLEGEIRLASGLHRSPRRRQPRLRST